MRFLADECLSQELAKLALARGHFDSSHVAWIGKRGMKDWNLMTVVLDGDWTFVTRNAYDFRGPKDAPGSKGLYGSIELHPGLVCLTAMDMSLDLQLDLFEIALDELALRPDLINQVLEINADAADPAECEVRRYSLPVGS